MLRTIWCFVLILSTICLFVRPSSPERVERQNVPRYLLITPNKLVSGTANRFCLSRFGSATRGNAAAQLELLTPVVPALEQERTSRRHKPIVRLRKTFSSGNGGCFELLVPKTPHRKLILHLRLRFDALPEYKVNTRKIIKLQHDTNLIIVQLDKPLYRAGENVRFRILQLKPDLIPLHVSIYRISIESPPDLFGGGTKAVQWTNVSTQLGLVDREYQLDKYAQQGEWRIVVESQDMSVQATVQPFQVTDYTLPSYYLTVKYDKNVLITYKQLIWSICAKYMYGEGVNGKLMVAVSSDAYDSQDVISTHQLNDSIGCFNYTLRTKQLGFDNLDNKPKVIIAHIALQEEGTKTWKNTSAISHISKEVINIEYVNRQDAYFKPGLPHKVKVKVTNWKDEELANAKVQLCRNLNQQSEEIDNIQEPQVLYDARGRTGNESQTLTSPEALTEDCETGITDARGFVSFAFNVDAEQNPDILNLKASVLDHPLKDFELRTQEYKPATTSIFLKSWGNVSKVNIEIGSPLFGVSGLRPGSRHTFPLFLSLDPAHQIQPITLHYALITCSGILLRWGTSTQCPRPIHDVQNIQTVYGPVSDGLSCPQEDFTHVKVYKVMVPVKISHQMCPCSYLLVYFTRPDGEIVVANKHFKVNECFPNKVSQQWIPETVAPSSTAILRLRSTGPALCMLGVTNVALKHVTSQQTYHNNIEYKLTSYLESRFQKTHASYVDEICFLERGSPIKDERIRQHYENTYETFLISGVEVLTDSLPIRIECPIDRLEKPLEISYSLHKQYTRDRSYFPESWLWDIRIMDSNGSLDVRTTVPDDITEWESQVYCLSRTGLATPNESQKTNLKVFQPFFIELTTPKVMKRGEDVHMLYKIFNYMDHTIPVSIDLEITPTAAATLTSHQLYEVSNHVACIHPGQSLINHFSVRAHQLRSINITVSAQILNNMHYLCRVSTNDQSLYDVRDSVVKEIIVIPEGLPTENHKSALLCTGAATNKTEFSWTLNRVDCVHHSETWLISLVGDVTGPMAMNVENLISMPVGCGEQNMMMLAYNLIALDYSLAAKRVSADVKQTTMKNLLIGYQRQLTFWHSDTGAFSAFGHSDGIGSTWLTAFCLKYLQELNYKWSIGSEDVTQKAAKWLLGAQMENGCFKNTGQVFHREMKGGLRSDTSSIALAAYVIISLIDSNSPLLKPSTVQNTAYCLAALKYNQMLRSKTKDHTYSRNPDRMYTFALATLAQLKIEKYERDRSNRNDVLEEKRTVSKREVNSAPEWFYDTPYNQRSFSRDRHQRLRNQRVNNDGFRASAINTIFEEDDEIPVVRENGYLAGGGMGALATLKTMAQRDGNLMWWEAGSLPVSIETTGYAILSLLAIGGEENILDAMSAARWLSLHRNSKGGFMSTQDTLIALDALCTLRHELPDVPPSLSVMVKGPGRGKHFTVSPAEKHKLHTVLIREVDQIDISPTVLNIKVEGTGCMLVQATQRYNTLAKSLKESPFRLFAKIATDGTFDCQQNKTWCMCAAVLEICVSWHSASGMSFPEMALLEVQLPTSYAPDRSLLYPLIKKENILLRRIEESANSETLYMYLSLAIQLSAIRPNECYNLYLVGPKSHTLPASIRIYDYYHTETVQTTSYTIPELCPHDRDRRPHEEPVFDLPPVTETAGNLWENWHIIDSDYDLEMPRSMEGVPPVYALPPENFNKEQYEGFNKNPTEEIFPEEYTSSPSFQNWTFIDTDLDLDVPEGLEANRPIWAPPPQDKQQDKTRR